MRYLFLLVSIATSFFASLMGAFYFLAINTPEVAKAKDLTVSYDMAFNFGVCSLVCFTLFLGAKAWNHDFDEGLELSRKWVPRTLGIYSLLIAGLSYYFSLYPESFMAVNNPEKMKALAGTFFLMTKYSSGLVVVFVALDVLRSKLEKVYYSYLVRKNKERMKKHNPGFEVVVKPEGMDTLEWVKGINEQSPNYKSIGPKDNIVKKIAEISQAQDYLDKTNSDTYKGITIRVDKRLNIDDWMREVKKALCNLPKNLEMNLSKLVYEIHIIHDAKLTGSDLADSGEFNGCFFSPAKSILINHKMMDIENFPGFFRETLLHELSHAFDFHYQWLVGADFDRKLRSKTEFFRHDKYDSYNAEEFWAVFCGLYLLDSRVAKGGVVGTFTRPEHNPANGNVVLEFTKEEGYKVENIYQKQFEAIEKILNVPLTNYEEVKRIINAVEISERNEEVKKPVKKPRSKKSYIDPALITEAPEGITAKISEINLSHLTLSDELRDSLDELVSGCKDEGGESWGFEEGIESQGDVCLFFGEPGTGKTYCAEAIAGELSKALWTINLSKIKSKYVGETEEKVGEIFRAAQRDDVLLFMDECDFLLSNRESATSEFNKGITDVILQNTEPYNGLLILATNLKANIDGAMKSRITKSVNFKKPPSHVVEKYFEDKLNLKSSKGKSTPLEENFSAKEAIHGLEPSIRDAKNTLIKVGKHLRRTKKPLSTADLRKLLVETISEEDTSQIAS